jgi:hypothetical protein
VYEASPSSSFDALSRETLTTPTSFHIFPRGADLNLLVVRRDNNAMRPVTMGGAMSTVAGNGVQGCADGGGRSCALQWSHGHRFWTGKVYHRLLKIVCGWAGAMPTGSFEPGAPGTYHGAGTAHASRSPGLTPCALTSVGACWSRSSLRVAEASSWQWHCHLPSIDLFTLARVESSGSSSEDPKDLGFYARGQALTEP